LFQSLNYFFAAAKNLDKKKNLLSILKRLKIIEIICKETDYFAIIKKLLII